MLSDIHICVGVTSPLLRSDWKSMATGTETLWQELLRWRLSTFKGFSLWAVLAIWGNSGVWSVATWGGSSSYKWIYIYITIVTDDFQLYEGCYDSHIPATQSTPPKGPHPSLAHSHVEARHVVNLVVWRHIHETWSQADAAQFARGPYWRDTGRVWSGEKGWATCWRIKNGVAPSLVASLFATIEHIEHSCMHSIVQIRV